MDQNIIDLYDQYTHKPLPRRIFMSRLAALTGGVAAAEAVLPVLENNFALAQMVPPGDKRIKAGSTSYKGEYDTIKAYLAHPAAPGKYPAVVVIHENRGLNPHIEDVTRRLAVAGFLAIAPDALSPQGGTPRDEDKARDLISRADFDETLENYIAAIALVKKHKLSTGKVGCVGFCWGGRVSNYLALRADGLDAAVVFYGRSPDRADEEDIQDIRIPLLLHYAGLDTRINRGVPAYEAALKKAGVRYTLHMYKGVNHAFHNDTSKARYNAPAAKLAWKRTLDFFRTSLQ